MRFVGLLLGILLLSAGIQGQSVIHEVQGVEFSMCLAPAALFPMGTDDDRVGRVASNFWMGETQVTYGLWHAMRIWAEQKGYSFAYPGREGGDREEGNVGGVPTERQREPVTSIGLGDVFVWCNALSSLFGLDPVYLVDGQELRAAEDASRAVMTDGNGFRLPTHTEWELAARFRGSDSSGNALEYPSGSGRYWTPGNHASGAVAPVWEPYNPAAASAVAWYEANSGGRTHPVGLKQPNSLGIFDMSGNVWEYNYVDQPYAGAVNHILVGGYWGGSPRFLQTSDVFYVSPASRFGRFWPGAQGTMIGFRLARNHEPMPEVAEPVAVALPKVSLHSFQIQRQPMFAIDREVHFGETLELSTALENRSDATHTFVAVLTLISPQGEGMDLDVQALTVASGETVELSWHSRPDEYGEWTSALFVFAYDNWLARLPHNASPDFVAEFMEAQVVARAFDPFRFTVSASLFQPVEQYLIRSGRIITSEVEVMPELSWLRRRVWSISGAQLAYEKGIEALTAAGALQDLARRVLHGENDPKRALQLVDMALQTHFSAYQALAVSGQLFQFGLERAERITYTTYWAAKEASKIVALFAFGRQGYEVATKLVMLADAVITTQLEGIDAGAKELAIRIFVSQLLDKSGLIQSLQSVDIIPIETVSEALLVTLSDRDMVAGIVSELVLRRVSEVTAVIGTEEALEDFFLQSARQFLQENQF